MSRIRATDTRPERRVRSELHRLGFRFRLHSSRLVGKPDIVLPRHQTVIFVHGCYWHRHTGCKYAYMPKAKVAFWKKKFAQNIQRDRDVRAQLEREGWRVITIWECQTKDSADLKRRLQSLVGSNITS